MIGLGQSQLYLSSFDNDRFRVDLGVNLSQQDMRKKSSRELQLIK